MLALERLECIRTLINEKQAIKVHELSELFGVTEETIRRDLEKLEQEGILKRTYGGAMRVKLQEKEDEELPIEWRAKENLLDKTQLAKALVQTFKSGEIIMLDASTTSLEIAKALSRKEELTIITNAISIMTILSEYKNIQVIASGGIVRKNSLSLIGPTAKESIKNYYADKAIISCKGVDLIRGIMDSNELEIEIKKTMMAAAKETILAVDTHKFGARALYQLGPLEAVQGICTNKSLPKVWQDFCEEHHIQQIIPSKN